MGRHIVEIAASGNLRLESPGQRGVVAYRFGISLAQRLGIADLDVEDLADPTALHDILHLLEIRQVSAVIRHETGDARLFGDTVDAGTVFITGGQRFLYIHGFAGLHRHNGVGGMTRRRGGHIDGIHIRIVDKTLGIGIPFGDAVFLSISAGTLLRTAHHRHHARARYFAEGRTTFQLCHLTASDESPL